MKWTLVERAVEVLVDLIGDERAERREQLRDRDQTVVERQRTRPARRPRTTAASAGRTSWRAHRRTPAIARPAPVASKSSIRSRTISTVASRRERVQRSSSDSVARTLVAIQPRDVDPVGVRVQHVEAVGVPQLEHELAHRLADRLQREAIPVPRVLGGEEVPAERIGPVAGRSPPTARRRCRATCSSCGPARPGSARGRRRSGRRSGRTAASRPPASSRTSPASDRAPRR